MEHPRETIVGPPIWPAFVLLPPVALAGAILAATRLPARLFGSALVIVAGLACARATWALLRRRRLRFDDAMFRIRGPLKEWALRYDEIEALAVDAISDLAGRSIELRAAIRSANGVEIRLSGPLARQDDPVIEWIDRVEKEVLSRARGDLIARRPVRGADWALDRESLSIGGARQPVAILLSDIGAVDHHDGGLVLWRRGETDPIAMFPDRAWNTSILTRLLPDLLVLPEDCDPPDGLGRRRFERKSSPWARGASATLAACAGLGATLCAGSAGPASTFTPFLACFALLMGGVAWYLRGCRLICHSRGLRKMTPRGESEIRFTDVAEFRYLPGGWPWPSVSIDLVPRADSASRRLRFDVPLPRDDRDVVRMRDEIAGALATRWLEEIRGRRSVPWAGLRLGPDGLEMRDETVPYSDVGEPVFLHGRAVLCRAGGEPIARLPARCANLWPGLALLRMLGSG